MFAIAEDEEAKVYSHTNRNEVATKLLERYNNREVRTSNRVR